MIETQGVGVDHSGAVKSKIRVSIPIVSKGRRHSQRGSGGEEGDEPGLTRRVKLEWIAAPKTNPGGGELGESGFMVVAAGARIVGGSGHLLAPVFAVAISAGMRLDHVGLVPVVLLVTGEAVAFVHSGGLVRSRSSHPSPIKCPGLGVGGGLDPAGKATARSDMATGAMGLTD